MSEELVRAVHVAREVEEVAQQVISLSQMVWAATNADVLAIRDEAKEKRAKAEEALREAGLKEYEATKNKKPFPGVGIRVSEKPLYSFEMALAWAQEHHLALSLDKNVFEGIVSNMDIKPSFVVMEKKTTATIATDLGKVLEGVGE
ncbi:hypothetical protein LCGC14_0819850 [marine sediment metagenome]|uniref:Uncharacterized protein n=1 Tax=marine sediment metagenome TaxID=412755 RepID=A0A0F9S4A3_9ZZZZ